MLRNGVGGAAPAICAVLGSEAAASLRDVPASITVAELRLDQLRPEVREDALRLSALTRRCAARYATLIATYHAWHSDEVPITRIETTLRAALEGGAHIVDVAAERGEGHARRMLSLAHALGRHAIVSLHVANYPANAEMLDGWVAQLAAWQPRWVKLAVQCETLHQAEAVMSLYARYSNLIAIPMGQAGTPFRVALCRHGAPFTYAYYGAPAAPGQLSIWEMLGQQP